MRLRESAGGLLATEPRGIARNTRRVANGVASRVPGEWFAVIQPAARGSEAGRRRGSPRGHGKMQPTYGDHRRKGLSSTLAVQTTPCSSGGEWRYRHSSRTPWMMRRERAWPWGIVETRRETWPTGARDHFAVDLCTESPSCFQGGRPRLTEHEVTTPVRNTGCEV